MSEDNQIRALIGLAPEDTLEEVAATEPPLSTVARGLQAFGTAGLFQAGLEISLLRQLTETPAWSREEAVSDALPGADVFRWQQNRAVFALEGATPARTLGSVELDKDRWILDTRASVAALVLPGEGAETIIVGENGRLRVLRAWRADASDHWTEALADWRPPSEELPEVPNLDEILGDVRGAAWVLEAARGRASSPVFLDRLASLGLLSRFALSTAENRASLVQGLTRGAPSPASRVRDWAAGLDTEIVEIALQRATETADALLQDIDGLHRLVVESPEASGLYARLLRTQRDDLFSVEVVLTGAGAWDPGVVEALDGAATEHLLAFDAAESTMDPAEPDLLIEVSWESPDAWWGTVRSR